MAQGEGPECQKCRELKEIHLGLRFVSFFKNDLFESPSDMGKIKKKKLKKEKAQIFLKYINAFMNDGGGILCLHVEDAHLLGSFEQSVNRSMADMIPDNTTFPENFERHVVGKNHVLFRVKPRSAQLSTLSFNTKVSFDCGVENPNHEQMRNLLKPKADEEELYKEHSFTFRENDEVGVEIKKRRDGGGGDPEESVFQERKNIQAKRVMVPDECFVSSLEDEFFNEDKPGTYLPKYISAFCKLRKGGSIFLGLREKREYKPKWRKVQGQELKRMLTLHDPKYHLWKDSEGMYIISEESRMEETETGVFRCEGITLTQEERTDVLDKFRQLISTKMTWIPYQSAKDQPHTQITELPDLVKVRFHDVQPDERKVVLEIEVGRYQGTAFHSKDGPVAYCFSSHTEDGNDRVVRMTTNNWLHNMCGSDE